MKVKYVDESLSRHDEWRGYWAPCPYCKKITIRIDFGGFKFCPQCGKRMYYQTPKKKTK